MRIVNEEKGVGVLPPFEDNDNFLHLINILNQVICHTPVYQLVQLLSVGQVIVMLYDTHHPHTSLCGW